MSRRTLGLPNAGPAVALLALALAGCAALSQPAGRAAPPPAAAWLALGPAGPLARAIVTDPDRGCPELWADGSSVAMGTRVAPSAAFDVLVCDAPVPAGARSLSVAGVALAAPPRELRKIALIGDTGCRIKCGDDGTCSVQACNDPTAWPFAAIARRVAAERPDLVIHVGDYYYRESPCPAADGDACGGSPSGDVWATWKADFLDPAAPLLAAAPWLFVRGNHEECDRGGEGWLRLLDSGPYTVPCDDDPDTWAVDLPGLRLLVLDTAAAGSEPASYYAEAFQEIDRLAQASATPAWLLMHHPLWAALESKGQLVPVTSVLQEASGNDLAAQIGLVVTGHVHLFEAVGFGDGSDRAPSLVIGMSGTALDGAIEQQIAGTAIAGEEVATAATFDEFGYAIAVAAANGWRLTVHDAGGAERLACDIAGRAIGCERVGQER